MLNISREHLAKLELMERGAIKRNLKFAEIYGEICEEFRKREIDFVPVKGVTRLKNSNFKRPMRDIDFWIESNNIAHVREILIRKFGFTEILIIEDSSKELCMQKKGLLIECKDISSQIHMTIKEFQKNSLKKEIYFCYEAWHAMVHHGYGPLGWFYDGYRLFIDEKLCIKNVLDAARLSGTIVPVKGYLIIISRLFGLKIEKKYFSIDDFEKADLFFDMHNPLLPLTHRDSQIMNAFLRVAYAGGWSRVKYMLRGFIPNRNLIGSRKKQREYFLNMTMHPFMIRIFQFYFFPKMFKKWLKAQSAALQSELFYLEYVGAGNLSDGELVELLLLTDVQNTQKSNQKVKEILSMYYPSQLMSIAKKKKIRWLIDAWLSELHPDYKRKRDKTKILGIKCSRKDAYKYFFIRHMLVLPSYRKRLRIFIIAMFPSLKTAGVKSRKMLISDWISHAADISLWAGLAYAFFGEKHKIFQRNAPHKKKIIMLKHAEAN